MRQFREELIKFQLWWYCSFGWENCEGKIGDGVRDSHFVIVWFKLQIRHYLTEKYVFIL